MVWLAPGPEQGAKPVPSTRHSKLKPASEELKVKVGLLSVVVPWGPESIRVSGGVVSRKTSLLTKASELPESPSNSPTVSKSVEDVSPVT